MVKVKGIMKVLDGKTFVIPPLNLLSLEQIQERLEKFDGGIGRDSVSVVIDAATAALRRNYPDITRDEVATLIDVGNMHEIMTAVMDVSGLLRKEQEGETPPGEV